MAGFPKFQTKEVLNKVLNSGEDALKVDIDNVTLKTEGSDITIEVHTDKAEDSMLVFSNTTKDGSGTSYVPLVDSDGHLQLDVLSSALPSGAATAANQATIIGHVDGVETLITSTNTKLDTLETTANALETLLTGIDADTNAIKIDAAAMEALLITIDSDTSAIKTAVELLDNSVDGNYLNVNNNIAGTDIVGGAGTVAAGVQRVTLASNDPAVTLLGTIDSDTNDIKTATEGAQASLADMIYGTAVAIDISSGNHTSLSHNALYVGTGGNVKVNMGTSGSGITFSNVASGQILPIQITQVYQSGTTASNMVALKE
jgi:hypothetical protein|tara:strand:- start:159 stop:1106 length:948 start_codon:yes stop_codon:yes gene_type:complete